MATNILFYTDTGESMDILKKDGLVLEGKKQFINVFLNFKWYEK